MGESVPDASGTEWQCLMRALYRVCILWRNKIRYDQRKYVTVFGIFLFNKTYLSLFVISASHVLWQRCTARHIKVRALLLAHNITVLRDSERKAGS